MAQEISKNNADSISKIVDGDLPGFEETLRLHRRRSEWHAVYNNDPRYRGRARLTIAHEFSHYQLHQPNLSDLGHLAVSPQDDYYSQCKPLLPNTRKEAERQREEEADIFASFLPIPLDDYRTQVNGEEMTVDLMSHITNRYSVSLLAASRRWIDFTDRRTTMIVARDGFALWGRASKSTFKGGIFIRSGMPIPDNALASIDAGERGFISREPVQRSAGIWSFSRDSEPVREPAMTSESLDISLTILQFDTALDTREIEEGEPWDAYDQFQSRLHLLYCSSG